MVKKPLWYVIQVHAGFEKKIAQAIRETAERQGLSQCFEDILVPSEEVVEIKRGVKVNVERNYFPGYVLVRMALTDEAWHMVCSLPKVSVFLGNKGKPLPIPESEVNRIMNQVQESIEKPRSTLTFEIGEQVRVMEGPFASFTGLVEEVEAERSRLKVSVMIFGRPTPVELEFTQVEKV